MPKYKIKIGILEDYTTDTFKSYEGAVEAARDFARLNYDCAVEHYGQTIVNIRDMDDLEQRLMKEKGYTRREQITDTDRDTLNARYYQEREKSIVYEAVEVKEDK